MGSSIPVVDLVLALVLIFFAIAGARRGMVKELFSLFFLLVGILIWVNYQNELLRLLTKYLGWFSWMPVATFTLVLLASLFVSMVLDSFLFRFIRTEGRKELFALFGGVVGLYRGVVICAAILWIIKNQPFKQGMLDGYQSYLIPKIEQLAPFIDDSAFLIPGIG